MQLSRAAQYGIVAVAQLKTDGDPIPCSTLSKVGDMPERFLLQVMRQLVNAGLVKSTRGVDGGYTLTRPLDQISVGEIREAIDGPIVFDASVLKGKAFKLVSGTLKDAANQATAALCRLKLSQLSA